MSEIVEPALKGYSCMWTKSALWSLRQIDSFARSHIIGTFIDFFIPQCLQKGIDGQHFKYFPNSVNYFYHDFVYYVGEKVEICRILASLDHENKRITILLFLRFSSEECRSLKNESDILALAKKHKDGWYRLKSVSEPDSVFAFLSMLTGLFVFRTRWWRGFYD